MAEEYRHFEKLDPNALHPSPMLFEKARTFCFAMVVLGAIGVILGWIMNPQQFYFSYLSSWTYCWTLLMGVLFFVILHYLVDAGWDTVIRRPAEQLLATMPVIVIAMIPIVIGLLGGQLYEWRHPAEPITGFKHWFLSLPTVLIGLCVYAAIWLWLSYVLRGNSLRQDADGLAKWTTSSRKWSAAGILLYGLSLTGCALHLLMSLDYRWFSTMWGVYVWSGAVVGGLAMTSLIVLAFRHRTLHDYISSDTIHDIGKLTFAFNCFWGYIAFSQYFLIWYGNIPEETDWFLRHWTGTTAQAHAWWWTFGSLFPVGMFVLPFLILMSAHTKRNRRVFGTMCVIMLVAHWIEVYWIVQPEMRANHQLVHLYPPLQWVWIDLAVILLIAGAAGIVFIHSLRKAPLFPPMDPRLVEALSAEHVEEIEHADVD